MDRERALERNEVRVGDLAALELAPLLLTIGQMARHFPRMTGKRWKIDWDTVLARRRIYQARTSAEMDAFTDSDDADVVEDEAVKSVLRKAEFVLVRNPVKSEHSFALQKFTDFRI